MAYYRIGPVEVAGGPSVGFLVIVVAPVPGVIRIPFFGDGVDIVLNYETAYFSDGAAP